MAVTTPHAMQHKPSAPQAHRHPWAATTAGIAAPAIPIPRPGPEKYTVTNSCRDGWALTDRQLGDNPADSDKGDRPESSADETQRHKLHTSVGIPVANTLSALSKPAMVLTNAP